MNRLNIKFDNHIKSFILYTIISLLFLQFLKDIFSIYYVVIGFFIILSTTILIIESDLSRYKINTVSSLYMLFLLLIIVAAFFSLRYYDFPLAYSSQSAGNYDNYQFISLGQILISMARILIMPTIVIYLSHLIINRKQLDNIIFLFIFFVCLGAFSLIAQIIFGHIPLFGAPNADRFIGFTAYSSSVGAVTTYATAFSFASILLMIHFKNLKFMFKLIILTILFIGAVASMGKAAIVNIFLVIGLLVVFLEKKERYYFLIYLLIALIGTILISSAFLVSVLSLIGNTFGIELADDIIHRGIYKPFYERVLDRVTGRNWVTEIKYIWEILLGWGTIGGGGAFGLMVDTRNYNDISAIDRYNLYGWEKVVNTTHNQYIDLFQIGGTPLLLVFILLLISMQYYLLKDYIKYKSSFCKSYIVNTLLLLML